MGFYLLYYLDKRRQVNASLLYKRKFLKIQWKRRCIPSYTVVVCASHRIVHEGYHSVIDKIEENERIRYVSLRRMKRSNTGRKRIVLIPDTTARCYQ